MTRSRVTEVEINPRYLISRDINEMTFSDNYRLESDDFNYLPETKDLMIAFFLSFPRSFRLLLSAREYIASILGLKTAPQSDKVTRLEQLYKFKGLIGDKIAIFEVLDKNETELLTGQRDSHLDFKLSFVSLKNEDTVFLELATTVLINNTLGKAYFAVIKPIHRFYMKRILLNMEKKLRHKSW